MVRCCGDRLTLVLVSQATGGVRAEQSPPAAPQVVDACGDATTRATVEGQSQSVGENQGHVDVRSVTIAGVYDTSRTLAGITARLDLCGPASAEHGGYRVAYTAGGNCWQDLQWTLRREELLASPPGDPSLDSTVTFAERCYGNTDWPHPDGDQTVFRQVLPADAVRFEGSSVTFTLPLSTVPEAGRDTLAEGTRWAVLAVAMDQTVSEWGYSVAIPRGEAWVGADIGEGTRPYVVGEDRPPA